ncbi:MAG: 3-dehydroquinate synthase [Candidatus Omnitrophica bacterium]|nr:3-dehydroquinate synthase [Candidatus Omnitrophota bacterium]
MKQIDVILTKSRSYPIFITDKDFSELGETIKNFTLGSDAFIITNANIHKLYADDLRKAFNRNGIQSHFYKIKDSEQSKSVTEYIKTVTKISSIDVKKKLFLVALGGGVVGDLCGFVAATYKRGIPYVQVPTTLLAQVDSSIGGKTAIDLPSGKNLIGAFFHPVLVYSNINLLKSLPIRQIKSGLAEVIKYGIILDPKLFEFLEKNQQKILNRDHDSLKYIISQSSRIKAYVVSVDEKETKGFRTILNFGHTIGHALETANKYSNLTHGEAITMGMVGACEIASELGLLRQSDLFRMTSLLQLIKLPEKALKIDLKAILDAFSRDKKFIHGKIRMVLPTRIGHVIVADDIPFKLIKKIIQKQVRIYNGN